MIDLIQQMIFLAETISEIVQKIIGILQITKM